VAGVMLVSRLCRSCRGRAAFGKAAVGGVFVIFTRLGFLRWSRQPAAGAAGPSVEADLSSLTSWRFLGRQLADGSALGLPG
jgi:hypothetical protein